MGSCIGIPTTNGSIWIATILITSRERMNSLEPSTDLITKEELLASIRVKPLIIHYCSICNFPCAYYYENEVFGYDSGCDCDVGAYEGWEPRSENELDF